MPLDSDAFECRLAHLKERYKQIDWPSGEIDGLMDRYRKLVLKIEIGDERIARLCQVLTDHGCVTFESCEGHGRQVPRIWFFPPKDPKDLMLISHILQRASYAKNFPWHIVVNGNVNASQPLTYILEPSSEKGPINLHDDYNKLMQDLDIIAISILDYLSEEE